MALFRFHRGSLDESLKTTIIVKTLTDVIRAIVMSFDENMIKTQKWGAKFEIIPYPSESNNFDKRIGWYTHMVLTNMFEEDKMHPVGFLSEPLE